MVRKWQEGDLNRVAEIWLDTNRKAHNFISPQYWNDHFETVKEMFLQAEIYVYEEEEEHQIEGFIGMDADYVAGIFVLEEAQGRGLGKALLDFIKERRRQIYLNVYQKNMRAVKFYQREGFHIQAESVDENTGEKEYQMIWTQEAGR
ncbi:N-acetyltransferase [Hominifimenecus sp. rT4P-3]|uniref:N-acetyltransferase n=1 Tax=Hominifimenecus sp. rT4P-3 TaxID=3242979 RepID=UPI003DA51AA0